MDLLLIALIVLAVVSVGGWGYGTYSRPVAVTPGAAVAGPGWVSPLGIIGLIAVVGLVLMLATGWRPLVVGP